MIYVLFGGWSGGLGPWWGLFLGWVHSPLLSSPRLIHSLIKGEACVTPSLALAQSQPALSLPVISGLFILIFFLEGLSI